MKSKIICFDLDNTLCISKSNNYKKSKPIKKNIRIVNSLFEKGYYIKIFTSRFMGRNNDNLALAKKNGYKFTIKQLKKWKLKCHKLIFGKPSYDIFIDDKALGFKKNWFLDLKKKLKKIK
jgi:hypothetical protein